MMNELITGFTNHLKEAIELGKNAEFKGTDISVANVLICGLGGSGIGGSIIAQLVSGECKLPVVVNKDYNIPNFVSQDTLVICCSYSGNTEETLSMYEQATNKGATIAIITSGGKFDELAASNGHNIIKIPGGLPPRAAFGLSFPQLLFTFSKYGLIEGSFVEKIEAAIELIDINEKDIQAEAKMLAGKLLGKTPVIYCEAPYEGVAIRFRQQINENSKMLCWHHVIPEMNHNELVGWRTTNDELGVVVFRSEQEYYRNSARIEQNKTVFGKYTNTINEVYAKGKDALIESLYLIHLGDWVSEYLADLKKIDSVEVDVITGLKNMLSDLD